MDLTSANNICPLLLRQLNDMLDQNKAAKNNPYNSSGTVTGRVSSHGVLSFKSLLRTVNISSPEPAPIEQLAQAYNPKRIPQDHEYCHHIQFDVETIVTGVVATVVDKTDPFRRLPHGGLKLFRFRIEESNGNQLTISDNKRGALGNSFWVNGNRPAIIPNGLWLQTGQILLFYCTPLFSDLEIELGVQCLEQRWSGGR